MLDPSGVDLDTAATVTYVLHQHLRFTYDGPAFDSVYRLVVIPRARHGSLHRRLHSVEVSDPEARTTTRRDGAGNVVLSVRLDVIREAVEFNVAAVLERRGAVADARVPLAKLRSSRYLRPTRLTTADAALRALAEQLRAAASDDLDFAERCCDAVRSAIAYQYGVTSVSTTAAQAYAAGRGVCQDHAHVMIAVCRAAGVPARYVSGHLLGEGGSHAWVEVLVRDGDAARAVAMDPCNGCRAGARHLTIATGRDYAEVAPTSGCYEGAAASRLTIRKRVGVTAAA